jgi:hypothetical protein
MHSSLPAQKEASTSKYQPRKAAVASPERASMPKGFAGRNWHRAGNATLNSLSEQGSFTKSWVMHSRHASQRIRECAPDRASRSNPVFAATKLDRFVAIAPRNDQS